MSEWNGLAPQHRYYLESRAVSAEVATTRGYASTSAKNQLENLGFGVAQRRVPSLLVPIWAPWTTERPVLYQHHPDDPRRNGTGRPLKFEFPTQARMHLDVHPSMREFIGNPRVPLVITEGVVKADAGVSRLSVCVVGIAGVWAWRGRNDDDGRVALADWEHVALNGRDVIVCFDSDVMLKESVHEALVRLGAFLCRHDGNVHYAYLPPGPGGRPTGLDDWLADQPETSSGELLSKLVALCEDRPRRDGEEAPAKPYEAPAKRSLAEVLAVFHEWLEDPDDGLVETTLATVVANRAPGDPVWTLVVAPPSSGKTEAIMPVNVLPDVLYVGKMTDAALLSGTAAKERARDADGGLLREIGERGILLYPDFGDILAMQHDTRQQVLQAMRRIYDGHYVRDVGVEGHRKLRWDGHCGFIGAATEAIDSHHAVIAALGDRYLTLRLRLADAKAQAQRAIDDNDREEQMRQELGDAVAGLLGHLDTELPAIDEPLRDRLADMATLAVRCRSVVDRDSYKREIVGVPKAEQPARFAKQLAKLHQALLHIGCDADEAWRIVKRVTLDSMPAGRHKVLDVLASVESSNTSTVSQTARLPTTVVRRHLEDLEAHEVVDRQHGGEGRPDVWRLSAWTRERWPATEQSETVPEKSDCSVSGECDGSAIEIPNTPQRDFSGKVPPADFPKDTRTTDVSGSVATEDEVEEEF